MEISFDNKEVFSFLSYFSKIVVIHVVAVPYLIVCQVSFTVSAKPIRKACRTNLDSRGLQGIQESPININNLFFWLIDQLQAWGKIDAGLLTKVEMNRDALKDHEHPKSDLMRFFLNPDNKLVNPAKEMWWL